MGWDGGWGCSAGLRAVPECALRVPPGCARTERCAELRCGAMEAERRRRPAVRGQPGGGGGDGPQCNEMEWQNGTPTPPHTAPLRAAQHRPGRNLPAGRCGSEVRAGAAAVPGRVCACVGGTGGAGGDGVVGLGDECIKGLAMMELWGRR